MFNISVFLQCESIYTSFFESDCYLHAFMHLARDLQSIQGMHYISTVCVLPGDQTMTFALLMQGSTNWGTHTGTHKASQERHHTCNLAVMAAYPHTYITRGLVSMIKSQLIYSHNILPVWYCFHIKNVISVITVCIVFYTRYWSPVDEMLREAAVLRKVKVRLLISLWTRTHPLTFNFMTSMQALCTGLPGCSVEAVRNESDGLIRWYNYMHAHQDTCLNTRWYMGARVCFDLEVLQRQGTDGRSKWE